MYPEINKWSNVGFYNVLTHSDASNPYEMYGLMVSLPDKEKQRIKSLNRCLLSTIGYRKYLMVHSPKVSVSINSIAHTVNILVTRFSKVTPVLILHEMPTYNPSDSLLSKIILTMPMYLCRYFKVKNIIAVSNGLKNVLMEEFSIQAENISVLYNPINLNEISLKSLEPIDDDFFHNEIPIIISVGNVLPVKGHWHLLRVFDRVCEFIPCKLVICGDITRDENYMQYISDIHNNMIHKENVIFTGWTENPYKYMKRSTVFVLSSLSEALPYCLIEALACGCPIVASNCVDGIGEILNNGEYGLLCDKLDEIHYSAGDPLTDAEKDMMEKILYLLENPDVRQDFARKGIERAKDFDKEVTIKKYIQYFESLN